jgi:RimJ/RimL family protein N-acetyltransferase
MVAPPGDSTAGLKSPDIAIRPLRPADAAALVESVRESIAELRPWMPWCHAEYTPAEAEEWVEKQIAAFEAGREYHFAIISGQRQLAGVCGLNAISQENQLANLGYWVRTALAGRGIATEATRLLVKWAFDNTNLNRLEILVAVRNHPSLRVAAKAGAVWEGVLRGRLRLHGVAHDAVLFSIVRNDR